MPYFIDGEVKVTESSAIPIYIIKKNNRHELLGENANGTYSEKEIRIHQILGVLRDINKELMTALFNPEFNNIKEKLYNDKLSATIKVFILSFLSLHYLIKTTEIDDLSCRERLFGRHSLLCWFYILWNSKLFQAYLPLKHHPLSCSLHTPLWSHPTDQRLYRETFW